MVTVELERSVSSGDGGDYLHRDTDPPGITIIYVSARRGLREGYHRHDRQYFDHSNEEPSRRPQNLVELAFAFANVVNDDCEGARTCV